jgi:sugar/nucleoside kinase (ribokinase family)
MIQFKSFQSNKIVSGFMKRDIIGLGVANIDVLYEVESWFIDKNKLVKDSWNSSRRKEEMKLPKKLFTICGGSPGNTIANSAFYGCDNGFIGTVGSDRYGRMYRKDLKLNGIEDYTTRLKGKTNLIHIFITPDKKRTSIGDRGVSTELRVPPKAQEGYKMFHFDMFGIEASKEEALKAFKLAGRNKQMISFDLSDPLVVKNYKSSAETIVKHCNVVFANEKEAESLVGGGPEYSVEELSTRCDIAVVKMGEKGSLVKKSNGPVHNIPCVPVKKLVDTTGAGDAYAAGFHRGLLKYVDDGVNVDVRSCGHIGSLLASKVCEVYGARII